MEGKVCNKCKIKKTYECFGKHTRNKDGLQYICKKCTKQLRKNNRKAESKEYYLKNKDLVLSLAKIYKKEHKEDIKEYMKAYRKQHNEEIKKQKNKYHERMKESKEYRILRTCRLRLWHAIKGSIKSNSTINLIGCSIEKLIKHLESQFKNNMTWENYGEWHIDHIKPCKLFDFEKEEDQRECFNYKNLQPLWKEENLAKGAKY